MKIKIVIALVGVIVAVVVTGMLVRTSASNPFQPRVLPAATSPSARDSIRKQNLEAISTALNAYVVDHGQLPIKVTGIDTEICVSSMANCKKAKLLDLSFLTASGKYLLALPSDPIGGPSRYGNGYTLARDTKTGKFRLTAPRVEGGTAIVVLK